MFRVVCLSLLLFSLYAVTVHAETLTGTVVRITDGDTLVVLDAERQQHKIRMVGIDAPESKQPFGQRSKQALSALVAGQAVAVEWHKRDRYQRILGKVMIQGEDVNLAQISSGMAWWYRQYANEQAPGDRALYAAAEAQARQNGVGLWREKSPVAPWEWRQQVAAKNDP